MFLQYCAFSGNSFSKQRSGQSGSDCSLEIWTCPDHGKFNVIHRYFCLVLVFLLSGKLLNFTSDAMHDEISQTTQEGMMNLLY